MVCVDDARIVRRTYACNCFKIVPKPHQLVHVVLAAFLVNVGDPRPAETAPGTAFHKVNKAKILSLGQFQRV